MKKIFIVISGVFLVSLSSCLKDKSPVDFSTLKPILQSEYPAAASNNGLGSGLQYFGGSALLYPGTDLSDTAIVIVNMDSPSPLGSSVSGTFGVISTALTAYNSDSLGLQYELMPDSDYSILNGGSFTIPANRRIDTIQVVFYPSKIDPTHNYLLPAGITAAGSYAISQNFNVVYFHTIGNPIAGVYNQEWIRYNTATQTPPPAFDVQEGAVLFAPVTPTEVDATSGTGVVYIIDFTNTGGVLSNFTVSFPSSGPGSASADGISITSGPTIITADPTTGTYQFNFTYLNGSGAPRNITDIFTK
ncbi:MAG TPA: DUF1735 domain-containing protein [Puia sp.]|nr:DUF1735 domain-containing protein [Puia sp.]